MSLPFDATLKDLVQTYLPDYERSLGLTEFAPLVPLNVDLATISAATDIALGHGDPPDHVVDLNFQSGPDPDLAARMLMYQAILHYRYRVPVHSVVVLLRPAADHPHLTGRLRYSGKRRKGKMDFSYEVIRLWQRPTRPFLTGGLGALPLASLCRLPVGVPVVEALEPIIRQIAGRLTREALPEVKAHLPAAAYVLTGLRVSGGEADQLFQGVQNMEESSTYQAILARGSIKALQNTLLRQGQQRFGVATASTQAAIQGITDEARLERMTERVLVVSDWQELLATP
jgi:hypothetical protein